MFQTTNQLYIYMFTTGVNIHIFQLYVTYMPFISGYKWLTSYTYNLWPAPPVGPKGPVEAMRSQGPVEHLIRQHQQSP